MKSKIKCIVKRADEPEGHMTNISNTLENLQRTVDGYIEAVPIRPGLIVICNEDGFINQLPYNCRLAGHFLFGDIIVCGVDGVDFGDIPITFQEWKEMLSDSD